MDGISIKEFEIILNSTHDAMIAVDGAGLVTIFNAAAERVTGLKAENCLGRPASEVIPNTRLHHILLSGEPELNQQQKLGGITIVTNRVPVKDEKGKVKGAVAIFRDVSEIKSLAEQITDLREVRSLLEAIIRSTQDAFSVVDENGIGLLVNPAYTRLTGLTEADVLNKPATVDIAEGESMHYKVLRTQQPVHNVPMKVGPRKRDVVVNVAPVFINGKLKGSVGVIHDISEITQLTRELESARQLIRRLEAKYTFDDIVGGSPELKAAMEQARRAAATPATVLLRGESGTGKELFAHAIHNVSSRRKNKFVRVNCAAIAETLLESELFGYEEGAFTGASKGGKVGFFEEANGGTIFLDEIGNVNMGLQSKLLRVLQEKELVRVGGTKAIPVDVRVIAATNANLEKKMKEGTFRDDLYYRLNVVPIYIPPLRQRKHDLPALAHYIIRKFNQEFGRNVEDIHHDAVKVLMAYNWPGNIRELENVLGRAIINMHFKEDTILPAHLPPLGEWGKSGEAGEKPLAVAVTVRDEEKLDDIINRVEKDVIRHTLAQEKGNKTNTAKRLGISTRNLYYKLQRYGLPERDDSGK